jgi:hypothetical protein
MAESEFETLVVGILAVCAVWAYWFVRCATRLASAQEGTP